MQDDTLAIQRILILKENRKSERRTTLGQRFAVDEISPLVPMRAKMVGGHMTVNLIDKLIATLA